MKLQIKDVSKTFFSKRKNTLALDRISLDIKSGEFLCLLGPSGCGKSTLLNMLAGFEYPQTGSVFSDGESIKGPSTQRVLVFQEAALFPWLTVEKNVAFGLEINGMEQSERKKKVKESLEMVHLLGFEQSYCHELSGGMKQRVALARALILKPAVLLMDEPFAALDALTRDKLHEELQLIWEKTKMSVVFVTHNIREALILGDRVVLMSARPGKIKKEIVVNLPRPRHFENPGIVELARTILGDLQAEAELAERQLYGDV